MCQAAWHQLAHLPWLEQQAPQGLPQLPWLEQQAPQELPQLPWLEQQAPQQPQLAKHQAPFLKPAMHQALLPVL